MNCRQQIKTQTLFTQPNHQHLFPRSPVPNCWSGKPPCFKSWGSEGSSLGPAQSSREHQLQHLAWQRVCWPLTPVVLRKNLSSPEVSSSSSSSPPMLTTPPSHPTPTIPNPRRLPGFYPSHQQGPSFPHIVRKLMEETQTSVPRIVYY